jgi:type IV pilus assembly protein PilA
MLARLRKAAEEREGGFTLIELLVVIIIIGILAAIAIPVFLNQRQKGYDAQAKSDLRNLATAEETYLTDNPTSYRTSTAPGTDTELATNDGFKQSSTTKVGVIANGSSGYCSAALSQSGKYFWYDSQAGGLFNGSSTALTTLPTGMPTTGACGVAKPTAVS